MSSLPLYVGPLAVLTTAPTSTPGGGGSDARAGKTQFSRRWCTCFEPGANRRRYRKNAIAGSSGTRSNTSLGQGEASCPVAACEVLEAVGVPGARLCQSSGELAGPLDLAGLRVEHHRIAHFPAFVGRGRERLVIAGATDLEVERQNLVA